MSGHRSLPAAGSPPESGAPEAAQRALEPSTGASEPPRRWANTGAAHGLLRPPALSDISQPESVTLGSRVTLSCHIWGHFPGELRVTWFRKEKGQTTPVLLEDSDEYKIQSGTAVQASDGKIFRQETRLSFTPSVQRDQGAWYICRVRHVALEQPVEKSSAELQVTARPELSGIQVWPRWDPPDTVPFAVRLHGFYPRGIHRIAWSWDGDGAGREEPPDISPNPDGTFTATSVWRVPSRSVTGPGLRVRVCVQHGPADPPLETELRLGDAGLLRPPALSDISQPESVPLGSRVTLSSRISGHFPAELRVTWLRKGKGQAPAVPLPDSDDYEIQPGMAEQAPDGKSFQQETRLIFTPSVQRDQGAQYICRVQHVALERATEKRSSGLQVTGLPQPLEVPQISESESVPAGRGLAAGHSPRQPSTSLMLSTKPVPVTPQTVPEWRGTAAHTSSGLLRPPALSDISQPESVPLGSRVTLSCCISGHFPAELRLVWLWKGKGQAPAVPLADSDDYEIQLGTAEQAPDGKSFQQETRLIFTPSVQRDQGAQYICRVQHVALEQPVEKSSAELQVTGLPWPVEEPQISESESVPAGRGVAAGHSPRQSSTSLKLSTKPVPVTPQTVPERRGTAAHTSSGLLWAPDIPDTSRNRSTSSRPKDETDEPQRREETEPEQKPSLNSSGPQQPRGPLPPLEVPDISRNRFTSLRHKDETDEPQRREETEPEQKPSLNSSGPQQPRDLLQPPKMPGTSGRVTSLRQMFERVDHQCQEKPKPQQKPRLKSFGPQQF